MDEYRMKEILIEWFKDGTISLENEVRPTWNSVNLVTKIFIDSEKVYEWETELESK